MKETILVTLFSLLLAVSAAMPQQLDSLKAVLNKAEGQEKVDILNELYIVYSQLDPAKALEYSRKALTLATELDYKKGTAAALNNIGVIYKNQGIYDQALEYYIQSLRVSSETKDQKGLASTMNNIGTVYSLKGVYDKALIYFIESYEIFKTLDDKQRIIGTLNNIGNAYNANGREDKALEYFTQALNVSEELGLLNTSDPLLNIGNIYFNNNDYRQALEYYEKSLNVEKDNNNLLGQALALTNIGSAHLNLGDVARAEKYQNEAKAIAETMNANPMLKFIYNGLSQVYYEKGEYKNAYEARILYDEIKDYVQNEESSRKLAQLEVAFELQRKEKELEVLKQEQEIKDLQVRNSRVVILLALMGAILFLAVGFIVYKLRKAKLLLNDKVRS